MRFFEGLSRSKQPEQPSKETVERLPEPTPEEIILNNGEIVDEKFLDGGSLGNPKYVRIKNDGAGVFKNYGRLPQEWRSLFINAERAAYIVSRLFSFDVVPPTVIRTIDDEEGSFQKFVPHTRVLSEISRLTLGREERFKLEFFDALIMNPDRHSGNVIVRGRKVIAIDNGSAFSIKTANALPTKSSRLVNARLPKEIYPRLLHFKNWIEGQEYLRNELAKLFDVATADAYLARIQAFIEAIDENGYLRKVKLGTVAEINESDFMG